MPSNPIRRAHGMALITAVIWSFAFVCIRQLHEEFREAGADPQTATFALFQGRMAITALCFLPGILLERRHIRDLSIRDWIFTLGICLTMTFGYHLPLNHGAHHLPSGFVGLLVSLSPLFGAFLARLFLKENLGPSRIFAVILGFSGIGICLWAQNRLHTISFSNAETLMGPLWIMLAALDGAIFALLGRTMRKDMPVSVKLGLAMLLTILIGAPLWTKEVWVALTSLSWIGWAALAYLSIVSTYIASLLWYEALRVLNALPVMIYLNVTTVLGLFWGALFFREQLRPLYLVGAACVVAAVFLTSRSSVAPAER
jgi:drug/metabolite transporter (DMT)-like permease